jgi:hypothetical protein
LDFYEIFCIIQLDLVFSFLKPFFKTIYKLGNIKIYVYQEKLYDCRTNFKYIRI